MNLGKWIVMLVLAGMPAIVSAEFYRYVDEQGKVHYTDEFGNVPPDQRPKVDEYEEFQDQVTSQEAETAGQEEVPLAGSGRDVEEEVPPVATGTDAEKSDAQTETQADADEEKSLQEELREVGAELEEEYQALLEERKQLDEASKTRMGAAVRAELVEKIRDFNARIKDYEGRREAYNREVEAYNASIAKEAKLPVPEKE
jgi:hypothetical protein